MTDLTLHIGSNKTGTTYIQGALSAGDGVLAEAGVGYPVVGRAQSGAHHFLAGQVAERMPRAFKPKQPFEQFLGELKQELLVLQGRGLTRVLISSESMFLLRNKNLERLQQFLALFENVTVVVYLRRQDKFLPSFYNSLVRTGMSPPTFDEFCRNQGASYLPNLDAWSALVGQGRVLVRPFERCYWRGDTLVDEFLATCDIPLHAENLPVPQAVNESLSLAAIDILRAAGPRKRVERWDRFARFVDANVPPSEPGAEPTLMTEAIYRKLKRRFHAENLELGRRYMAPEAVQALAFDDDYEPAGPVHEQSLPVSAAAVLVALWKKHLRAVDAPAAPKDAPI